MEDKDIKIFLLEPIDDRNPKKKLVYADDALSARKAAAISSDVLDRIYGDRDLSTCVQIDPEIIIVTADANHVKFKYNEVIYDLVKDKAEDLSVEVLI